MRDLSKDRVAEPEGAPPAVMACRMLDGPGASPA